jgi:(1->4)-alpha-D-glucan 1-alpha-D-glucosylmutase
VERWRALNAPLRTDVGGVEAPDPMEEYLFYQTLVGAWPVRGSDGDGEQDFPARIRAYLHKALLEAKVNTSWVNHNEPYENAVDAFVQGALDPRRSAAFLEDFARFHAGIARPGFWNALAQLTLKLAVPGVPDFYQGTELWDLSLVDPDNRRPVDYQRRRTALGTLQAEAARDARGLARRLLAAPEDGRVKLFVASRALRFRRAQPDLFQLGEYQALEVTGARADSALAFARVHQDQALVAVVGRRFTRLGQGAALPVGPVWEDTRVVLPTALARRPFRDVLTDSAVAAGDNRTLPLREALAHLPVALLST